MYEDWMYEKIRKKWMYEKTFMDKWMKIVKQMD